MTFKTEVAIENGFRACPKDAFAGSSGEHVSGHPAVIAKDLNAFGKTAPPMEVCRLPQRISEMSTLISGTDWKSCEHVNGWLSKLVFAFD